MQEPAGIAENDVVARLVKFLERAQGPVVPDFVPLPEVVEEGVVVLGAELFGGSVFAFDQDGIDHPPFLFSGPGTFSPFLIHILTGDHAIP